MTYNEIETLDVDQHPGGPATAADYDASSGGLAASARHHESLFGAHSLYVAHDT